MDKGQRVKRKIQCRADQLKPLQNFLIAAVQHYNRPDIESVKWSKVEKSYSDLCDGFMFLNDQGISLSLLSDVLAYAKNPQPAGDPWSGFLRYLDGFNNELELIPDQGENHPETAGKQPTKATESTGPHTIRSHPDPLPAKYCTSTADASERHTRERDIPMHAGNKQRKK